MITSSVAVIKDPLAPQILRDAGVPFEDALWYSRVPPERKVQALVNVPRGQLMLENVRSLANVLSFMQEIQGVRLAA